ncbi:hypothetical protein [Streptomyces sp. NPDC088706]|uniref:hypothetical protein n=1 Tax=Streptomyces sp. NPDC088706 TaxID=3365870 RepID=UPI00380D89D0
MRENGLDAQVSTGSPTCPDSQDLAAETTRPANRIRGLLTPFHPGLECAPGPRLDHPGRCCLAAGTLAIRGAAAGGGPEVCFPGGPVQCVGDGIVVGSGVGQDPEEIRVGQQILHGS